MAIWQGGSKRKNTGGIRLRSHKKRKFEIGREPVLTTIGDDKRKYVRVRAGVTRVRMLKANTANVTNPKTGKTSPAKITTVTGNPANINYVRRNILTKGAVVDTDMGKVKVTSRPGQSGALSGILVK